ncbi:MAG: hypothetical protein J5903_02290 [Clostridia bacterium]|nr:hypothetical protein [Clostridia bacterium]
MMGKASKSLYLVGKVINVVELVLAALAMVLGLIVMTTDSGAAQTALTGVTDVMTRMGISLSGMGVFVGSTIMLVASIVTLALAIWAGRAIDNGRVDITPHVVMIVVGVFGNVFYLLGGVFGLFDETSYQKSV